MSNNKVEQQNLGANEGDSANGDICRDFLRNVCFRGKKCKFYHPDNPEGGNNTSRKKNVEFCHDYQNSGECKWLNCKYIHCSREEEDVYLSAGPNDIPICKDFLNGECRRSSCKFRHISSQKRNVDARDRDPYRRYDDLGEPQQKRYARDYGYDRASYEQSTYTRRMPDYFVYLEDENRMLMQKVYELKKQVAYLTSNNESLLEQNAQLRLQKRNAGTSSSWYADVAGSTDWSADSKYASAVPPPPPPPPPPAEWSSDKYGQSDWSTEATKYAMKNTNPQNGYGW